MSAYSDWKCGALTDEKYYQVCLAENRMDRILEEVQKEKLAQEAENE